MAYIPWVLMVWTVVTMWLAGNKSPWAWYSGIASQGLWLVFDYHVEAWGLMPLAVVLTGVYLRNLLRWRRERPATASTETARNRCAELGHPFQRCHCGASGMAGA